MSGNERRPGVSPIMNTFSTACARQGGGTKDEPIGISYPVKHQDTSACFRSFFDVQVPLRVTLGKTVAEHNVQVPTLQLPGPGLFARWRIA
jgi:hypothetical protein